jgi:hypothetical protein
VEWRSLEAGFSIFEFGVRERTFRLTPHAFERNTHLKKLLGIAYALIAALGTAIVVAAEMLLHASPVP